MEDVTTTWTEPAAVGSTSTVTLREQTGRDDLALVYLLQLGPDSDRLVETVDSIDPRFARHNKTVIILSTQCGCPVGCQMCDAGGQFIGNLSADEMLDQVRFVLQRRPEIVESEKLKVHFARMGEPALNPDAVIEALDQLPSVLPTPALVPCIATVAPARSEPFFERLAALRKGRYARHDFQLQLSINTTDRVLRQELIPISLLELDALARISERFRQPGSRKVVLNFALAAGVPVDVSTLSKTFDPECFVIKLTPVNPTDRAQRSGMATVIDAARPEAAAALVSELEAAGYDTIVSIGEPDEITIGSNCGQMALRHRLSRS